MNSDYYSKIDREIVILDPIEVERIDDYDNYNNILNKLQLMYLLSIGIQREATLDKLVKELKEDS